MISNESEITLEERVNLLLKDEEENGKAASLWVKAAYSLGHVFNDLCAAMWFSYVLLYLQVVLQMDPTAAGALIFLGQVTDGIATPFAGFLADNVLNRRIWHIIGNGLVVISFPMIFLTCTNCELYPHWRLLYYSIVIILFQIGWAIVQITHLSMIPDVPGPLTQRGELTALRYTASVCSSVTFYLITWAVLHTKGMNTRYIGPADADKFKKIAIIVTIVGIITSLIFYTGLAKYKQRKNTSQRGFNLIANVRKKTAESKHFFSSSLIYQVSLLYVASRMFVTLSLIYMPLFLDERQTNAPPVDQENGSVEELASVPLVSYLASFVASLLLKYRHYCCGKKIAYFAGSVISVLGCIWVAFILTPDSPTIEIYLIAVLIGAGSSVTIVISLCMTADLIGPHTNQGAFVYSIVTFTDKLITGFAVVIIERIKCDDQTQCPQYYRDILGYACGGAALFGLIVLSTLSTTQL